MFLDCVSFQVSACPPRHFCHPIQWQPFMNSTRLGQFRSSGGGSPLGPSCFQEQTSLTSFFILHGIMFVILSSRYDMTIQVKMPLALPSLQDLSRYLGDLRSLSVAGTYLLWTQSSQAALFGQTAKLHKPTSELISAILGAGDTRQRGWYEGRGV